MVTRVAAQNKYPEQYMGNSSFDEDFGINMVEPVGFDGQSVQRMMADSMQLYLVSSGGYDYFCLAAPGSALGDAKWQVFRLDSDGNKVFANHSASFDNVATNPAGLNFSYA
jgi:hypothetical protein